MTTWSSVAGTTWASWAGHTTWATWLVTPVVQPPTVHTRVFRTPAYDEIPNVESTTRGVERRFYRHFRYGKRGINIFKLATGGYTEHQPFDPADTVYEYLGGHVYKVSMDEAAALEAAGYYVEPVLGIGFTWGDFTATTWGQLSSNVWADLS